MLCQGLRPLLEACGTPSQDRFPTVTPCRAHPLQWGSTRPTAMEGPVARRTTAGAGPATRSASTTSAWHWQIKKP
eukprot:3882287-Lingulodinium_polyedra.AAC.1